MADRAHPWKLPSDPHPWAHLCGVIRPIGWQRIGRSLPTLAQAGPDLVADPKKTVLLYKCFKEIFSGYPDYPAQEIGDCLIAGTMVMGETIKPIEDVVVGDLVWTGEGKLSRVVSTRQLETIKPLVRVVTKGGLPLTCTADHLCLAYRVPVISGKRVTRTHYERFVERGITRGAVIEAYKVMAPEWVPAGELTEDHYLLSPVGYDKAPVPDDALLAKLWGTVSGRRMLGYFVGDGTASGGSAEFCVVDRGMSDELVGTLVHFDFDPKVVDYSKDTPAWRVRVHSRALVACLRRHFYDAAGVKVFPGWAVGDADFLAGLIESDGCDGRDGETMLDSTSLSVIHGSLATLRCLGFNPVVSQSSRSTGTYANARPLYRITWTEVRRKHVTWRDDAFVCHRVKAVEFCEGPTTVYDIGVADAHHSFVANGFAVHNCVGFGHARANDLLMTVEAYLGDLDITAIGRTCTEFIYGEARKVSGDLGVFDGSYGGAAVKAMTTVGMVSYGELAEVNEPTAYAGSRAKKWGRFGPPTTLEPIAGRSKLGGAALLQSTDDMIAAIQNGHPCSICTAYGFTMTRDSQGFCALKGRWGHCMHIAGYRADRPGFLVVQSWGPDQPQGPLDLDQPSFSFWATTGDIAQIIAEGDSFALAGSVGFAPKKMAPELVAA